MYLTLALNFAASALSNESRKRLNKPDAKSKATGKVLKAISLVLGSINLIDGSKFNLKRLGDSLITAGQSLIDDANKLPEQEIPQLDSAKSDR